jgi:hypothetical protein
MMDNLEISGLLYETALSVFSVVLLSSASPKQNGPVRTPAHR